MGSLSFAATGRPDAPATISGRNVDRNTSPPFFVYVITLALRPDR
jgi:hypothetical protein